MADKPKSTTRGFAGMSQARRVEVAKKGGSSVSAENRTFSKDRDLAARAGHLGGKNSHGGGRKAR